MPEHGVQLNFKKLNFLNRNVIGVNVDVRFGRFVGVIVDVHLRQLIDLTKLRPISRSVVAINGLMEDVVLNFR